MPYSLLFSSLAQHITLTPEEQEVIAPFLQLKKLRRKEFLFREGEVHTLHTFVLKGCLRIYSIDNNGFEHILQFAPAGWWIGDMYSILNRQPGTFYVDAIPESEIVAIQSQHMEELYRLVPGLERYFRILSQNALITYQHRLADNLSLTARERYANFCKRYPSLIKTLPQKQVAAYIGVTPEFLSKMLHTQSDRDPARQ